MNSILQLSHNVCVMNVIQASVDTHCSIFCLQISIYLSSDNSERIVLLPQFELKHLKMFWFKSFSCKASKESIGHYLPPARASASCFSGSIGMGHNRHIIAADPQGNSSLASGLRFKIHICSCWVQLYQVQFFWL